MATSFCAHWYEQSLKVRRIVISHPADDDGGIVLTYNQAESFLNALESWRLAPGRPYSKDPEFPDRGLVAVFKEDGTLSLSKDKVWLGIDAEEIPALVSRLRELV